MNNRSRQFLKWCFIFLISKAAFADIFEYSKSVYGVDSTTCQNEALSLAKNIADATGGKTEAAYCAPLNEGGFDIRVLTESQSQPTLELAVFGYRVVQYDYPGQKGPINRRYSVISDEGVYYRVEDCLKVLPAYESIFKTQTGLMPISAQCSRMSMSRYVVQVDGFGPSLRHLYELNLDLSSGTSSKELLVDVTNYLSALGATPITTATPSSYMQVKYFANSEFEFKSFDFERKNTFITNEECSDALAIVQPIVQKLSPLKLVSIQCGKGFGLHYQEAASMSAVFDITGTSAKKPGLEVFTYGQFPSYSECRSKVPTLTDSYCSADVDLYGEFHGYALNMIRAKHTVR